MISQRQLFLQYLAQTSDSPLLLEVERAEGVYIYDRNGKAYIDFIAGISVCNLGHCHPSVIRAIEEQIKKYLHVMVYGEYIQSPQVELAQLMAELLPDSLNMVYFVNSGSEANEGAIKLAKRFTGRNEVIAFENAYHGSTQGALSVTGNESLKQAFRPLLPGIQFLRYNNLEDLHSISNKTACVIIEPVQGEAGVIVPDKSYLHHLKQHCNQTGTLLVFDEVQTGFGRLGSMFAFEKYGVIPDILTLAKGMGGGMPIGAFIASEEIMSSLKHNPVLGHITTFGGHPVSCAAACTSLKVILQENLIHRINHKSALIEKELKHELIKQLRGLGLFYAIELEDSEMVQQVIKLTLQRGVLTDFFLFNEKSIRIAPPLIITEEQIKQACNAILESLDEIKRKGIRHMA